MRRSVLAMFCIAVGGWGSAVQAADRPAANAVGEIITTKGDEFVRLVGSDGFQRLAPSQKLLPGDVVRTGEYGGVAILFRDETQVRVQRNSTFEVEVVRQRGEPAVSRFKLLAGSAWSRAKSLVRAVSARLPKASSTILEMSTPTATIGIRGTDWHVMVKDGGETVVTVVSGEVSLSNELGSVDVAGGEQGVAVRGQAPTNRVIVDLKDRPLMALEIEPRWFEMLTLSDADTVADIQAQQQRTLAKDEKSRDAGDWMTLARAQYDRGQLAETAQSIEQARRLGGGTELQLIEGMLRARNGDLDGARPLLEAAVSATRPRDRLLAGLGIAGLDFDAGEYAQAERKLNELAGGYPDQVQAQLYRPALAFFAGDQDRAVQLTTEGERRFPADARFPALLSAFSLLRGDDDEMRIGFERALAIDPLQPMALNLKGTYYHDIRPDEDAALGAYETALGVTNQPELWNNYALLLSDLGRDRDAEAAHRKALAAAPDSPLVLTNYAMWLVGVDRIAEARALLERALQRKPGYSTALAAQAFITLIEGDPPASITQSQGAIVANPAEPQVYSLLSFAQYHDEQFADAEASLQLARKADPDDPLPMIIGAVMAQDQAEAGKAIRYAREGAEKVRSIGSLEVESIVNTRSGVSNLGSAYTNLDLDDWGEYYAQQSFSPYDPSSHLFLSFLYPSVRAQKAEAGQGLILDPLAVASSNRYFDFVRMPRTYLTINGGAGAEDNAHTDSAAGSLQGFARLPFPIAYNISAERSYNDGFRTNSEESSQTVLGSFGTTFNSHRDSLLLVMAAQHSTVGNPGGASDPDPDDESDAQAYTGSLGWQHRFDFDNRIMARVAVGSNLSRETNAVPFGQGLDPLLYSLIRQFGLSDTQDLVDGGLFDATAFFAAPVALTDSAATQAVCAVFPDLCAVPLRLSGRVDVNPIGVAEIEQHQLDLQFRQLFKVGSRLDFTYGAEWSPQEQEVRATRALSPLATDFAQLIDNRTPPTQFIDFFLLQPVEVGVKDKSPVTGAQAYLQALWKDSPQNPVWWIEAGAALRYVDDDTQDQTEVDPRVAVAWEPMRGHWLRAGYLREMGIPTPLNGTLAPIAVTGLAASDKLLLLNSQTLDDVQARWDAEWLPGLFSVVQYEHQDIDGDQRADELGVGVNTWFLERFGAFARYRHTWSEDTAGGATDGNELALLANHEADIGLSWVHPRQIRASVVGSFVGPSWADAANTVELDGYFTVGASVNWQPMKRHWSLTLAAQNLFDEDYDLLLDVPAPGTAVAFTAEYRF